MRPTRLPALGLFSLALLHFLLLLEMYDEAATLFSSRVIVDYDFPLVHYWVASAAAIFDISGSFWGYDPFYMAGYPLAHVVANTLPLEMIAIPLPREFLPQAVKIGHLLLLAPLPVLAYFAAGRLGARAAGRLATAALCVAYSHQGLPFIFAFVGMPGSYLAGGLMLYVVAAGVALMEQGTGSHVSRVAGDPVRHRRPPLLPLLVLAPLALLVHKTAAVMALPLLVGYAVFFRNMRPRAHAALLCCAFLALALNSFWLLPFFRHAGLHTAQGSFWECRDLGQILSDLFAVDQRLASGPQPVLEDAWALPLVRCFILILGVRGLLLWRGEGFGKRAVVFGLSTLLFLALIYLGAFWKPTRVLAPYRYLGFLYLLLALPAGKTIEALTDRRRGRSPAARLAAALAVGLLLSLPVLFPGASFARMRLLTRLNDKAGPPFTDLIKWIRENTTDEARVLLEDSGALDRERDRHRYGFQIQAISTLLTGRQFVGGPYPTYYLRHGVVSFADGRLLGREIEAYSKEELDELLVRYNLGWAVAWTRRSQAVFDGRKDRFAPRGDFADIRVYEIAGRRSFFLRGEGRLAAEYERYTLSGVKAQNGAVVIKVHWHPDLAVDPPREIERFPVPGDPIGFVKVIDPPENFLLFNSHGFR